MRRLRTLFDRLPWRTIFWVAMGAITFLALMPWSQELPKPFRIWDKLNHFAAFVTLSWLLLLAYRPATWITIGSLTLYGAIIEGIQYFLPWRSADWTDLATDALAAATGVLLWRLLMRGALRDAAHR